MYVNQMDVMVRKEQNKDLLREAERERLIGAVRGPSGAGARLLHKVAAWVRAPRVRADSFPALPSLTQATGN